MTAVAYHAASVIGRYRNSCQLCFDSALVEDAFCVYFLFVADLCRKAYDLFLTRFNRMFRVLPDLFFKDAFRDA